jgi:predicted DNA-binding transcriptional regulator AlpA
MGPDRLIPLSEVGRMLGGRSVKTVRRMIADGKLPKPVYVGRTPMLFLSDVVAFIETLREGRKSANI